MKKKKCSTNCPNCGAPKRMLETCEYCGTVFFDPEQRYDSVLLFADDRVIDKVVIPHFSGLIRELR